ncbi:MAG TPA: S41 family peptidase [Vicinamibacterales bacterium]|nr:S41 family peptidase [Vicinamibacterales bacterium]
MSSRTRLIVLFVSTPLLAFALVGGILGVRAQSAPTTQQSLRVFEDVIRLIVHNYVEEVNVERVMDGAMRGLADGLDPQSAYLQPAQVRAIEQGEQLAEGDVGIDLTRQYYLRVVSTREGSPAARAGLQPGDFVRAIDGKPTRDLSVYDGMRLLRGAPGSKVSLLVIRGNAADPHVVDLVRDKAKPVSISSKVLGGGVGYIRVPAFETGTADALRGQIADLTKGGATKLVVDLRQTTEGPLESGLAAASVFLETGKTIALKSTRDEQKTPILSEGRAEAIALPMVVLTNYGTAGAAELFASALAGNDRAKLVGERTNGRAGVQKLVKLPQGSGLWLTHLTYTTPKGDPIHEKGLTPAVEVEGPEIDFGRLPDPNAKDPILDKAIEVLG